jgi:hypothetical protein
VKKKAIFFSFVDHEILLMRGLAGNSLEFHFIVDLAKLDVIHIGNRTRNICSRVNPKPPKRISS